MLSSLQSIYLLMAILNPVTNQLILKMFAFLTFAMSVWIALIFFHTCLPVKPGFFKGWNSPYSSLCSVHPSRGWAHSRCIIKIEHVYSCFKGPNVRRTLQLVVWNISTHYLVCGMIYRSPHLLTQKYKKRDTFSDSDRKLFGSCPGTVAIGRIVFPFFQKEHVPPWTKQKWIVMLS